MTKKNVLLLQPSFSELGGTQKAVCVLGTLLAEKYNVLECAFDGDAERRAFKNKNRTISLDVGRPTNVVERLSGYVRKAARLNSIKREYSIDVTISSLWPADLINALSLGPGKRVSITHTNIRRNPDNSLLLRLRVLGRVIYRSFDRVVAVNEALRTEIMELFALSNTAATTIPNCIPRVPRSERPGPSNERMTIVWCGRIDAGKNLAPLLVILSRLRVRFPGIRLVVLGSGPLEGMCVDLARSLGLKTSVGSDDPTAEAIFLGSVPDPMPHMENSDLFVLTSKWEGFGLVIIEAMSVGLPIVASDCPTGGPRSILAEASESTAVAAALSETPYGYLLPVPLMEEPATLAIWQEAIAECLRDDRKRQDWSVACRRRANEFSAERIAPQWYALLEAL